LPLKKAAGNCGFFFNSPRNKTLFRHKKRKSVKKICKVPKNVVRKKFVTIINYRFTIFFFL